ncbi:putative baseplate assembly protein [Chloroflexota bacterium]
MALQTPNLDDRRFQDIVSEARSKIPLYCPKWTDYNLSDPGITLIEMFAWMIDILLYRLNRVPEKNYIKFMDLIGIQLEPSKPAHVNVTFRLSAPQPEPVTIFRGTEVATVRTETQEAITFTTDEDFTIIIPSLEHAVTTPDDTAFDDIMPALRNPDLQTPIFQEVPAENNALYLGYGEDLGAHVIVMNVQCNIEGIGVDPTNPPWAWEFWNGEYERWSPLKLESDTTGGFNTNGQLTLHIPTTSVKREVDGRYAYWIRCRATKADPKQSPYSSSPQIRTIITESIGGTIPASHALRINSEPLGLSDATPGQRFQLLNTPVLAREEGETLEVETENEEEYEPWQEVEDFANSGPTDNHFTCDSVSGEIQLGPSIRDPSGGERQYGKVPPDGRQIRFSSYRSGGGVVGNVGEGTIAMLRSSIPYVDSLSNYEAAQGGIDAETLESAKLRAPQVLRANIRAVTAEDFEFLALEASTEVARAKCISSDDATATQSVLPGVVRLLLVPSVTGSSRFIPLEELELPRLLREKVQSYLDERRLMGTRLEVTSPEYIPVAVEVQVRGKRRAAREQVAADVESRLYHYINPVCGGPDGDGWPFGRSFSVAEIYAALQGVAKVDYVEEVKIFRIDPATGERQEGNTKVIIPSHSLICSHKHKVTIAE